MPRYHHTSRKLAIILCAVRTLRGSQDASDLPEGGLTVSGPIQIQDGAGAAQDQLALGREVTKLILQAGNVGGGKGGEYLRGSIGYKELVKYS